MIVDEKHAAFARLTCLGSCVHGYKFGLGPYFRFNLHVMSVPRRPFRRASKLAPARDAPCRINCRPSPSDRGNLLGNPIPSSLIASRSSDEVIPSRIVIRWAAACLTELATAS